jgi:hypothetical protein
MLHTVIAECRHAWYADVAVGSLHWAVLNFAQLWYQLLSLCMYCQPHDMCLCMC